MTGLTSRCDAIAHCLLAIDDCYLSRHLFLAPCSLPSSIFLYIFFYTFTSGKQFSAPVSYAKEKCPKRQVVVTMLAYGTIFIHREKTEAYLNQESDQ